MHNNPFQAFAPFFNQLKNSVRQFNPEQLPQAPLWVQHAMQARLLLLLNHVLQQDERAIEQLLPHQDKTIQAQWRQFGICLRVTPAGLLALDSHTQTADLQVQIDEPNPLKIIRQTALGQRPNTHIRGDAQLASTIHWLAENVRWNIQSDLAHLFGDTAAQRITQLARILRDALAEFVNTVAGDKNKPKQTQLPYQQHPDKS